MTDTHFAAPDPHTLAPPAPPDAPAGVTLEPGALLRAVKVGVAGGQAVIDAVDEFGADRSTSVLRLGVLQLLDLLAQETTALAEDAFLLEAYRSWIDAAIRYYGPEPTASAREYARAASILSAEIQIAPAVPGGTGGADPAEED